MSWIFERLAELAVVYLNWHSPKGLTDFIDKRSTGIAQETASRVAMEYLNKQGFLHCALCPQRFGLQHAVIQVDGIQKKVMLCQPHYAATVGRAKQATEAIR